MGGRTIVVGDVHGCADELDALHRRCRVEKDDGLFFVGDLVAKGPDSRGVLARVRDWGARSVRGNHDDAMLRYRDARTAGPLSLERMALAMALDEADWALLETLPLWIKLEHGLIVHAGIVPGVPIEKQDPRALMNMRTLDRDGRPQKAADAGDQWGTRYPGPELVVFGHHARAGLQQHPHALGLDTGCVYGGRLTACILPTRELVSVPAQRAYAPVSGDAEGM